ITAFFIPKRTPCFRCMVTEGSDHGQTCDTVGVIAPVVDVIASLEVTETLKYLTGNTSHLRNTVHTIDLWYNRTFDIKFSESKQDRKSTRLNSSHVSISYAVFCLKKK